MAKYAGLIAAIASVAGAGTSIGTSIANSGGGGGSVPATSAVTATPTEQAKKLIPGTKADLSSRGLSGIAPEFVQGEISNYLGAPGGQLDILGDIQRQFGQQQGGGTGMGLVPPGG